MTCFPSLADGTLRDVEVSASRIRFGGRNVLHAIVQEITERKNAAAMLEQSAARLNAITDAAKYPWRLKKRPRPGIWLTPKSEFRNWRRSSNSCVEKWGKSGKGHRLREKAGYRYPAGKISIDRGFGFGLKISDNNRLKIQPM